MNLEDTLSNRYFHT